jgi:tetratricopeptide (TPR) repeat protein
MTKKRNNEKLFEIFDFFVKIRKLEGALPHINLNNTKEALAVGIYYGCNGFPDIAVKIFDKLIQLCPTSEIAWFNKALAFHQLGNFQAAIKSFEKALEINSKLIQAWHYKGIAALMLEQNEVAFRSFEKALIINDNLAETWVGKGIAAEKLDRVDEAMQCYERARKINSDYDLAWYNQALLLDRLGKHEEAQDFLDQALEINPHLDHSLGRWVIPKGVVNYPDQEMHFRTLIEGIADLYEWDQCDQNFYDNLTTNEWALLKKIITHEQEIYLEQNEFSWNESVHKSLFKKLWDGLTYSQRRDFLKKLTGDDWGIVKRCISINNIQEVLAPDIDIYEE